MNTNRKLQFDNNNNFAITNNYLTGVGVAESTDPDVGRRVSEATHALGFFRDDDKLYVLVGSINGDKTYPIDKSSDLRINVSTGKATFQSYGRIYTIRAFQDSDGKWASQLGIAVPAEALEEMYMQEVAVAFTPNAPSADEDLYAGVNGDTSEIKFLVYSYPGGMYTRSNGAWFKVPYGDETLDGLDIHDVDPKFISVFDEADTAGRTLTIDDIGKYAKDGESAMTAAGAMEDGGACPPATQDIATNLANRENAIKTAQYGPLNPMDPNDEFWQAKADRWTVTVDEARKSTCGTCVMFIRTKTMLDCIAGGLEAGDSGAQNAWDAIDTAELGYCEAFDFKCAASRTCNAWVVGGPITDEVNN